MSPFRPASPCHRGVTWSSFCQPVILHLVTSSPAVPAALLSPVSPVAPHFVSGEALCQRFLFERDTKLYRRRPFRKVGLSSVAESYPTLSQDMVGGREDITWLQHTGGPKPCRHDAGGASRQRCAVNRSREEKTWVVQAYILQRYGS